MSFRKNLAFLLFPVFLGGCSTTDVLSFFSLERPLSLSEQRRLRDYDLKAQSYFKPELAQEVNKSELTVKRLNPYPILKDGQMLGSYRNEERFLDRNYYLSSEGNKVEITFHESIHHLVKKGKIDVSKFMNLYNRMITENSGDVNYKNNLQNIFFDIRNLPNSGATQFLLPIKIPKKSLKYPIIVYIEDILKRYNSGYDTDEERLAYFLQFYVFNNRKLTVSDEMKSFLSQILN